MADKKITADTKLTNHSEEWHEGWKAYNDGKALTDNPYMADRQTKQYMRWQRGWEAAQYQNSK